MTITVFYFASLREAVGVSSEKLALPEGVATIVTLRAHLAGRGEGWRALVQMKNLKSAVNQTMVAGDAPIADGDEVAFFPPVTGG
ncbi:MAG: molybdopterin converting factor subunit 1 [Rhodocyclaceae bacterium]|nr:molybdopterin converting factor subunit 1 [Rhodocyclaceae bacterium]